jgi:hypothetical protein
VLNGPCICLTCAEGTSLLSSLQVLVVVALLLLLLHLLSDAAGLQDSC